MVLLIQPTINTNIGQVQIFEGSSQFGKDAQSKMNNSEEFLRKELKINTMILEKMLTDLNKILNIYILYL